MEATRLCSCSVGLVQGALRAHCPALDSQSTCPPTSRQLTPPPGGPLRSGLAGLPLCPMVSAPRGGPCPPGSLTWLPAPQHLPEQELVAHLPPAPSPVLVPLRSLPSISCSLCHGVASSVQNICENYKQDRLSSGAPELNSALRGEFV